METDLQRKIWSIFIIHDTYVLEFLVTTELANAEPMLLGEYSRICSYEPLITFSLIGQYITLLFVCFLFKDALMSIVGSLTLNGRWHHNSCLKEAH